MKKEVGKWTVGSDMESFSGGNNDTSAIPGKDCDSSSDMIASLNVLQSTLKSQTITRTDPQILDLWIQGIEFWYNRQDYARAVDCWDTAFDLCHDDMLGLSVSGNGLLRHLEKIFKRQTDSNNQEAYGVVSASYARSVHTQREEVSLAPLWLFLAGCCLDGGRIDRARRVLLACLQDSNQEDGWTIMTATLPLRIRAITELLASFEEGESTGTTAAHEEAQTVERDIVHLCIKYNKHQSYWADRYQRAGFLFPGIRSKAWWWCDDEDEIEDDNEDPRPDWCRILEEQYPVIRDEFEQLYRGRSLQWPQVGQGDHREGAGQHDGRVVSSGDWREYVLFGSGQSAQGSTGAPRTCAIIARHIPQAVSLAELGGGEVIFSVLAPGTKIQAHCATTNFRLTAHLGLVVPKASSSTTPCRIRVADQWKTWEEGKVLLFDDSYEHEVQNLTKDSIRVVLLLRFWHPHLHPSKRREAIELALESKRLDQLQRYNPPLPRPQKQVEERAMEQSRCYRCYRTGYDSIRLETADGNACSFSCSCGEPIA